MNTKISWQTDDGPWYTNVDMLPQYYKISTKEELLKLFPKAKELNTKITHGFWKVKRNRYLKVYYLLKNGKSIPDEGEIGDIDYGKFEVAHYYREIIKRKKKNA